MHQKENYRPVSNINSIAKIFEICVLQRLEEYDQDELIGLNQHGFRKHHGTDTAIADILQYVYEEKEKGKSVGIYSADLTAAFDLLQKDKLVLIMKKKGIADYLIRIIHSYLEERMGYVVINEARSFVKNITTGCVQGSILGPVLFNIYMSELRAVIDPCKLVSYADDSYIVVSYIVVSADSKEELEIVITGKLKEHFEWLRSIGMKCNMAKTELMVFGKDDLIVKCENSEIRSSESMKILGTTVDRDLEWEPHITKMLAKVRSMVFSLRHIRQHLSLEDTAKVIRAQIISRLTYWSPVWSSAINYKLKSKIRSVYYLIIRTALRDFNLKMNRGEMLQSIKLENIDDILFKQTSVFIFNIINNLSPTLLTSVVLSKSYFNERHPDRISFFDTSKSRLGRKCITNVIKNYTENWNFDWFGISKYEFKTKLKAQFQTSSR